MHHNASWRQVVGVAKFSVFGATFVMAIAMSTSYGTQVDLLLAHAVGWASWLVPLTIDVLALMSNLALGLPRRVGMSRRGLWMILVITLAVSMVLNFMAGANFIASTAHVWVVAAYLAAEYVRGWVKTYRAAMEDENEQSTTHNPPQAPAAAPVSPGMPAIETEPAEVLAFRAAQEQLRKTSKLPALNKA